MAETARVLHVLPHPGGGGGTYVDLLTPMPGYDTERIYLASAAGGDSAVREILWHVIRAARAARRADLLHVHGETASALCIPLLARRKSVVTIHGLHVLRRARGLRGRVARINLRLIVGAANCTICVSESEQREVLEVVGRRLAARVKLVLNGVVPSVPAEPDQRLTARSALGIGPNKTVGLFVASLDPHKDPLTAAKAAVEAVADGADVLLLVAGDGPLRGELTALERKYGGILRVLGHVSDVRAVAVAADFFVLPSRREGLSFALLDAMSFGLAPVVSDAAGNVDAVGDAGLVVRTGDVKGFAAAFRRLDAEPAERAALGERARERVGRVYSADEMIRTTHELYEALRTTGSV